MRTGRRWTWIVVCCAVGMLVLAGCGDDESGQAATTTASGEAPSQFALEIPDEPPTEIRITEPLPERPPTGKRIIFLQAGVGSNTAFTEGMRNAADVLGWTVQVSAYEPGKANGALLQAVAAKPDFIVGSGLDVAPLRTGLAAAHRAGIPVGSMGSGDEAEPETGFTAVVSNNQDDDTIGLLSWALRDSDGTAHVLFVNLPVFKVLGASEEAGTAYMRDVCADCKASSLAISPEQFGGGRVPSLVAAKLQQDPSIDYVLFTFNDIFTGVPAALKAAGLLDKVKLLVQAAGEAPLNGIVDGEVAAVTQIGVQNFSWEMTDWLARLSLGLTPSPEYVEAVSTSQPDFLVDTPEGAQQQLSFGPLGWPGPEGMEDQYRALWQVDGS